MDEMKSTSFIIDNIDVDDIDVSEPAAMDMVLMSWEQLQTESEEFMELLLQKLPLMVITWDQPWYQKSNSLTRVLKPNEGNEGESFRTDRFSSTESKMLRKSWKKFVKMYNLPNKPECLARWKSKGKCKSPSTPEEQARHFVMSFLAKHLERTLNRVYRHFINLYAYPVKGPYSEKENKVVEICFHHCPKNAVVYLSALLGRDPRNIYLRLKNMNDSYEFDKPQGTRMKFTLQVAEKFIKKLMKYSGCSLEEMRHRSFDSSIWYKLGEKMKQPAWKLRNYWDKLHVCLFVRCNVKLKKLRKKLFSLIQSTPSYKKWTDIRWKELVKYLPDGFTPFFLRTVAYRVVYGAYPNHSRTWLTYPLSEICSNALMVMKTRPKYYKKRLRTLKLTNKGKLEPIHYSTKME